MLRRCIVSKQVLLILLGESKKLTRLEGYGIRACGQYSRKKMFIYQSKANLDVESLFGNITHLVDPEVRKMLERGLFGNQDSTFILVRDLLAIEIKIRF